LPFGGYAVMNQKSAAPEVTFREPQRTENQLCLRGKVVMVNSLATSCVSCARNAGDETYNKFKGQGWLCGGSHEVRPAQLRDQLHRKRASCRLLWRSTAAAISPRRSDDVQPTTYVIDKDGKHQEVCGEPDFVAALHVLLAKAQLRVERVERRKGGAPSPYAFPPQVASRV
jgi:hypothetical protein